MHRVQRRLALYRARPEGRVDPALLAAEDAPRERAARLVRGALRAGRPVILRHARWAAMRWFLQDVAADLGTSELPMEGLVVDLGAVGDAEDTWTRIPDLLGRALGASMTAMVPASAAEFRERTGMAIKKGRDRRRRKVLLCLDADAVGFETLQSICDAWAAARAEMTPGTAPLLVLACQRGEQDLELEGALSIFVADPSPSEAVFLAAELFGHDPERAHTAVEVLGPVPAFLLAAARSSARTAGALSEAVGPLHRELRRAVEVACAEETAAARLAAIARHDALPFEQDLDGPLQRAGLVTVRARRGVRHTLLRSPLLRDLV